jgi:hypothetical protein
MAVFRAEQVADLRARGRDVTTRMGGASAVLKGDLKSIPTSLTSRLGVRKVSVYRGRQSLSETSTLKNLQPF